MKFSWLDVEDDSDYCEACANPIENRNFFKLIEDDVTYVLCSECIKIDGN